MTIKAGDLVMVVKPKPCCGFAGSLGKVFTVKAINKGISVCAHCGKNYEGIHLEAEKITGCLGFQIERIIKIDPPALQDETESEKELAL